ncbi:30S ribosomal protein S6--L-glutamate ligase [Corallococcus sp. H22C18031201]|uniref:ATP-grasp domain-containing protein n=1 Tax=Citreicoccus inhibens TaxID=2849499 RepID=UPI000E73EAB2|nr:RimK family alpha-L-glutamate ligase [Citreicoccus inhibens]MBU8895731.1 RimK family alpha-L-glutamate ligase [Citreicoccus inhibens]RJS20153.1 30S ribosomal protein S6--L-glutamate ligase [Corallococcus sp. H22C18031201]
MSPRKTQPKQAPPSPGAPAPSRASAPRPRRVRAKKTVAILSRKRSLYSTRRLVEAIKERGHRALVFDTLRCCLLLAQGQPRMTYRGAEVQGVDVVIPRIGASITPYGLAVVNHFEMMDVPVLNPATAIARSRDKLRALQFLSRAGLDIPRTVMANDRSNVSRLVKEVGGLPLIIKLIRGTQGVGVMIAHTLPEVQTILDTFWDLGQEILLQEFVAESEGRDVRALVVGDRVVGAMRRKAKKGEFRSNIHRGGEGQAIELSPAYVEAAVRAARIIGLEVAGVDMLEGHAGPRLMEINSSPGFEGLEGATQRDIAGAMVDHALVYAERRAGELRARERGG